MVAILQAAESSSGTRWQRLVRAGITDEICGCIIRAPANSLLMKDEYDRRVSLSKFSQHRSFSDFASSVMCLMLQPPSSWFPFLHVLLQGAESAERCSSSASNIFFSSVKKHWSRITKRVRYSQVASCSAFVRLNHRTCSCGTRLRMP